MHFDYIIVGAGLYGSILARELTDIGKRCLVVDKRNHIGGNCYSEYSPEANIHIHKYGPHIFHTNNKTIWEYINRFTEFNNFVNRPKVFYKGDIFSFPVNLFTLYQIFGCKTPQEAKIKLDQEKIKISNPQNLEEYCLSLVGPQIYKIFIKGYTTKQWGTSPVNLPIEIIKRIPIRLNFNDNYFTDKYQGIPTDGYTSIFQRMLKDIPLELGYNFNLKDFGPQTKIIYSGALDELFEYCYGELPYRSLEFETQYLKDIDDFQGNALINYTEENIPYTRINEHKHYTPERETIGTIITREFPKVWTRGGEKFYPIENSQNKAKYKKYQSLLKEYPNLIVGGRLGKYQYLDMHQIIGMALNDLNKLTSN